MRKNTEGGKEWFLLYFLLLACFIDSHCTIHNTPVKPETDSKTDVFLCRRLCRPTDHSVTNQITHRIRIHQSNDHEEIATLDVVLDKQSCIPWTHKKEIKPVSDDESSRHISLPYYGGVTVLYAKQEVAA